MRSGGIQIRVSDLLFAIRKRWKLILLLTIGGLVLGVMMSGVSYLQGSMSRNFEVTGSVVVITQNTEGNFTTGNPYPMYDDYRYAESMTDTVVYMMGSDKVLETTIDRLQLIGITTRDISGNLTIARYNETPVIEMVLTWRSAEEGIEIMNGLISACREMMTDTMKRGTVSIINEPSTRYLVGGGLNVPLWGYMVVLGFAAGIGIAILELLMKPTLINLRDVETNYQLETIGIIPKNNSYFRKKKSLLVSEGIASNVEQNYSAAAYILRNRLDSKVKHPCFYVTSATAGEGKTTVAANLAIQLSDMEKHVLLIDFNTQNPNLGSLFLEKVDYYHSLNALYAGEISEEDAVTTLTGYLDILPMMLENRSIPMDSAVINLVQKLTEKYDYVIIDAPPVGVVADTLSLNQIVSTVLFVIKYDGPTHQDIQDSLEKLNKSGIHVLGCVVNAALSLTDLNAYESDSRHSDRRNRNSSRRTTSRNRKSAETGLTDSGAENSTESEMLLSGSGKRSDGRRSGRKKEKQQKDAGQRGLFGRKAREKDTAETTNAEADASPESGAQLPEDAPDTGGKEEQVQETVQAPQPVVKKNIFDELDRLDAQNMSDAETMDALLRMGMDGEWKGEDDG